MPPNKPGYHRERAVRDPEWAEARRAYQREYYLRTTYGITVEQYDALMLKGCMVCGRENNYDGRRLHVDHCHTTGQVRGVLCDNCNRGVGMFKDRPELLRRAADYLEEAMPDEKETAVQQDEGKETAVQQEPVERR